MISILPPILRRLALPSAGFALSIVLSTTLQAQDLDAELEDLFSDDTVPLQDTGQEGEFDDGLDDLLGGEDWETVPVDEPSWGSSLRAVKGYVELKPRVYLRDRDQGRNDEELLFRAELELDFDFSGGRSAYFRPRVYLDLLNDQVSRFDPYEAYMTFQHGGWDLRAGQFVENWGIVDTYNPIDVLNRRDLGTDFLDIDRLGEIGVRYRGYYDGNQTFGEPTLSVYAVPVWQATPFPDEDQRFGFGVPGVEFDEDGAFEPDGFERGFYASRLQSTLNADSMNADLQVMASRGPDRTPAIRLSTPGTLAPVYYGVTTYGAGVRAVPNQGVMGQFLSTLTLKAEVTYNQPYTFDDSPIATPDDYVAFVMGVDRSFYDVLANQDALTLTVEYAKESGANDATTLLRIFQNDIVLRGLWEANDFARRSLELRGIFDLDQSESILEAIYEGQLRSIHKDLKLTIQFQHFQAASGNASLLGALPDNTSLAMGLRWDF